MLKLIGMFLRFIFLVKEIRSKTGELHFRRYRLIRSPWYDLYIHRIYKSDADEYPHSHPWDFCSLILGGSYREKVYRDNSNRLISDGTYTAFDTIKRTTEDFHKIEVIQPVTSLVLVRKKDTNNWGYRVDGRFVDHERYRANKNNPSHHGKCFDYSQIYASPEAMQETKEWANADN